MIRLGHRRWIRRVDLLASGLLPTDEQAAVQAHLELCPGCRLQARRTQGLVELMARDSARRAPSPLGLEALVRRVEARLDGAVPPRRSWSGWPVAAAAAAAGIAVLAVVPRQMGVVPSPAVERGGEALFRRMERSVSREQAARYLSDAQDVLVTVAGPPERCRRADERVDVAQEARRSRELLARRTLLLDLEEPEVASAAPVLEELEHVLREVAAMESCVRQGELDALEREIVQRRLLMRMDLAARELLG